MTTSPSPTPSPGDLPEGFPSGMVTAEPALVTKALAEVSAIGPYFEISSDAGREDEPLWRPLRELSRDTEALRARITDYRRRLGVREDRVAASILFQGLAARMWSPVVGTVSAYGLLPATVSEHLLWRPVPTGPLPLWAPPSTMRWLVLPSLATGAAPETSPAPAPGTGPAPASEASPAFGPGIGLTLAPGTGAAPAGAAGIIGGPGTGNGQVAELVYRTVVTEMLEPLAEAFRSVSKIASGLLWGNAGSALAGILRTLPQARPDLAPRAARLVGDVLRLGVLAGTGRLAEPAPGTHLFVRSSCCLYYRVQPGGYCDDCALIPTADRAAQWARLTGGPL
ncbi:(2Fe-2S)-binding protein [Sphaerisporangium sp. NPDC051017]|uniref:(2Fe-2S)-binding protein n=1 Tax=Sphaerisporangium sp. NPDC051017 TaxID=3154636 RepID=UPI0034241F79